MRYFIIDGNNLIHKIPSLKNLQKLDKVGVREKLAFMIDRFCIGKNVKAAIVFDGHKNQAIKTSKVRIYYSENSPADQRIKDKIDQYKNPKLITVISSDHEVMNYASKSSCEVIQSGKFAKEIQTKNEVDEEIQGIKSISTEEAKRIFGIE